MLGLFVYAPPAVVVWFHSITEKPGCQNRKQAQSACLIVSILRGLGLLDQHVSSAAGKSATPAQEALKCLSHTNSCQVRQQLEKSPHVFEGWPWCFLSVVISEFCCAKRTVTERLSILQYNNSIPFFNFRQTQIYNYKGAGLLAMPPLL